LSNNEVNIKYKMVLFGTEGVGKTSLVQRLVNSKFDDDYTPTLGYNVYEKAIIIDKIKISLVIYDFGGQKQFEGMRKMTSQGSDTAFLVYDLTNKESFDNLSDWRMELFDVAGEIPFIIIGNKVDLYQERQVTKEKGEQLSVELGALTHLETSAKTGKFVEEAFNMLARETLKKYENV